MQKFRFTVVNRLGKKLTGIVPAADQKEAHDKLTSRGFAILSLEVFDQNAAAQSLENRFEFQAQNAEKKVFRGTIEAPSQFDAYTKLALQFQYSVHWVVPANAEENEKEAIRAEGFDKKFMKRFEAAKKEWIKAQEKAGQKIKKNTDEVQAAVEKKSAEMNFIRGEIDYLIPLVSNLLEKNGQFIVAEKRRQIQSRLDLLSRLRQSNAVDHLQNLTTEVREELAKDIIFIERSGLSPEELAQLDAVQKEIFGLTKSLESHFEKNLSEFTLKFGGISTESLKETVKIIRPIDQVFFTLYWSGVFLFLLFFSFWIYNGLLLLSLFEPERAIYFFHSAPFWYLTGVSAIISMVFGVQMFFGDRINRRFTKFAPYSKYGFFAGGVFCLLIFSFQFPAFFFWT